MSSLGRDRRDLGGLMDVMALGSGGCVCIVSIVSLAPVRGAGSSSRW